MEIESVSWIYRCNHSGGAPSELSLREKALFLCISDEVHWLRVNDAHPKLQLERAERLSKAWFKRFLKKGKKLKPPIHVSSKRSQKSEEGRLQITRPMLNSLYDLLLIIDESTLFKKRSCRGTTNILGSTWNDLAGK